LKALPPASEGRAPGFLDITFSDDEEDEYKPSAEELEVNFLVSLTY
jgi:hypothetical protein